MGLRRQNGASKEGLHEFDKSRRLASALKAKALLSFNSISNDHFHDLER